MTINILFSTLYVFEKKLVATLKIREDKTLEIINCYISKSELKEFLQSKGYVVS